jgi:hypothetical protein
MMSMKHIAVLMFKAVAFRLRKQAKLGSDIPTGFGVKVKLG